ncbi:MAG: hypothetical protein HPZ79_01785 [Oscillospiraceae bacterium]|nr:hypothetical protein [Oscillospiraceae bacterium]
MTSLQGTHGKSNFRTFLHEHKAILILMAVLFIERVLLLYHLGLTYTLDSDDMSYVISGITFAKTGVVSMHGEYPSAQIMPGMTWLIGAFVLVFGEGKLLWAALKLLWIIWGTLTAWFIYRSVCMFAPKWCGVVASLPLFGAEFAWMDNLILTETPFMCSFAAMIYFTLRMGKRQDNISFWGCLIAYMTGLMLKANIAIYPLFAMVYLLIVKYDRKKLLKQIVIVACAVLCFEIPWCARNMKQFDAFIPLTYGAGNPTLLGTYQGIRYPTDESLDYETNVTDVVKEKYAQYYDENGNVLPQYSKYIDLRSDGIKANYRLRVWAERDMKSLIYSYGFLKPLSIINDTFYWDNAFYVSADTVSNLQRLNTILCVCAVIAALVLKRNRQQILFLAILYMGNVMIYAMTFAFGRYNASLMPARYILLGISISLFVEAILIGVKQTQQFLTKE